ncbi:hypothetical protein AD951_04270 [Acetobacter malorum]|uniref:Uncharacterized protein n=1 Tax=Acetobacter malorum TaxID=178901 RepID=A0A149V0L4_9PROT|nr:hypothetical protein [Acetobacter malorum]KXV69975.1 hypothetical protein AD951_04270 [Acetobacter malorum]KXV73800.1 hypothetical protein AD953_14560 [Acetobacter malorum]
MSFTVNITREAGCWDDEVAGRPLLQFQPHIVHAVIDADPTLAFEPDKKDPRYGVVIYVGNPVREEYENGESAIWFEPWGFTAQRPSDTLMEKMLELSIKLNAYMIDDHDQTYFLNKEGKLDAYFELRDDLFIIGDKGTHYEVHNSGELKNLNLIPDYMSENFTSFSEAVRKKFLKTEPLPAGQVRLYGPVSSPCAEFVKFYEKNNRQLVVVYYEAFLGLISGWNFANQDNHEKRIPIPEENESTTNEDIVFLYGYCRSFPRNKFVLACCALMSMRSGKTLKTPKFI